VQSDRELPVIDKDDRQLSTISRFLFFLLWKGNFPSVREQGIVLVSEGKGTNPVRFFSTGVRCSEIPFQINCTTAKFIGILY
jgi:hypothetical protein